MFLTQMVMNYHLFFGLTNYGSHYLHEYFQSFNLRACALLYSLTKGVFFCQCVCSNAYRLLASLYTMCYNFSVVCISNDSTVCSQNDSCFFFSAPIIFLAIQVCVLFSRLRSGSMRSLQQLESYLSYFLLLISHPCDSRSACL